MRHNRLLTTLFALLLYAQTTATLADTFGSGAGNEFTVEFVRIGDAGNPPDNSGQPRPAGSVAYEYRIGKYEISRSMIEKANAEGGLGIGLADMTPYGGNGPDKPASGMTWFEAAKFVNWLNTSTGGLPAYKFDANGDFQLWQPTDPGYDAKNLYRNSLSTVQILGTPEWWEAGCINHN
jgi:hypothetical protein